MATRKNGQKRYLLILRDNFSASAPRPSLLVAAPGPSELAGWVQREDCTDAEDCASAWRGGVVLVEDAELYTDSRI